MSYLDNLVEYGKSRFGPDVFRRKYNIPDPASQTLPDIYHRKYYVPDHALTRQQKGIKGYSPETKDSVRDMQTNYNRVRHQQYHDTDVDFAACEFVDYHEAVVDYSRYPTKENSNRVANHSYRRRFYTNNETTQGFIEYSANTLFRRNGLI